MARDSRRWKVLDLFSGAGGMSYGFKAHPRFKVIGGADAQISKPSSDRGTLQCNKSFRANIDAPVADLDLGEAGPQDVLSSLEVDLEPGELTVLVACAPCTGFSRTKPSNHLEDDERNGLVVRSGLFAEALQPDIFVMENARELINGQFSHHYKRLRRILEKSGYKVHGAIHTLDKFGLPQIRERALVLAVREGASLKTLEDLWQGYTVREEATTVERAIGDLPPVEAGHAHPDDELHAAPGFSSTGSVRRRIELIPKNGGSWTDIVDHPEAEEVLTAAMKRRAKKGNLGDHPDIYGRMAWDEPAPTIKRECAHVGNGRYAHPEQDRLCTVRELSLLQGFPRDYQFAADALSNNYRHVGDAVPPLVAYQIAHACEWMLTGERPAIEDVVLPNTSLQVEDILETNQAGTRQLELDTDSAMSSVLQEIQQVASGIPSGRRQVLLDIAESLSESVDQSTNPKSNLVSSEFADAFAARLLAHHALTKSVLKKRRFEYALVETAEAVGHQVSLARSSTNPGKDVEIDGTNFSLKTEAAQGITEDKITISKFQEARWIRDCDSPEDFAEKIRQNFGGHLSRYERILMLRGFQPSTLESLDSDEVRYDLVEVPVDLLQRALELPADAFSEPSDANSSGAAVTSRDGSRLFYVTLDGSVEKVTIRSLLVESCLVHGRWTVPLSV